MITPGLAEMLNELYDSTCCPVASLPSLSASDDLEALANELTQQVWNSKGIPEGSINAKAVTTYATRLVAAVNEAAIDWETPDENMLQALIKDVWHFSAAKNYSQLKQLSQALIGDDGKLREWRDFKKAAFDINDKHINQWLKAEYGLAVSGSQMAGKWVGITQNIETLPLLEFDAVIDAQTTDLCRSLHGTILPVDHPFWKLYYPPNHFSCRSTVRQIRSGVITTNIPSAEIPKMFQTNLGQQRLIFPPKHPYYEGLPHEVKEAADKLFKEQNG